MLNFDQKEELTKQLRLSERKRIQLQRKLSQKVVDDDLPLWSMVDIMTLLLIFFILMYSLHTKEVLSCPKHSAKDMPNRPVVTTVALPSLQDVEILEEKPPAYSKGVESLEKEPSSSTPPQQTASLEEAGSGQKEKAVVADRKDSVDATLEQLKQDVLSTVGQDGKGVFSVRRDQHRLVLVVGERITFRVGEAKLLAAYYPVFNRISHFIASKPDYQVMVSGHTDNTPIATPEFPSNLELSTARAINVAKFLVESGISPHRISVQGFSQYRPLFENNNKENRQANRRVEIELIKEPDKAPDFS